MATPASAATPFAHDRFIARRKVFALFAPKFHFYDPQGNVIGFLKKKAFKLRDDIRLYTDESMTRELLLIKGRQIVDFGAAFDVLDSGTQQKVGALKRRGWKSILKDEWIVMDAADKEIGRIKEDSALLATLRRFGDLAVFLPQKYNFFLAERLVGSAKQNFNPFVQKLTVDMSSDFNREFDRRLAAAAVVLLLAVEGRQG